MAKAAQERNFVYAEIKGLERGLSNDHKVLMTIKEKLAAVNADISATLTGESKAVFDRKTTEIQSEFSSELDALKLFIETIASANDASRETDAALGNQYGTS